MELTLKRKIFTDSSTIGELYCNDAFICYILEDTDRGLTSDMDLAVIASKKVYGQTAIATGRYEIIISYSNRFKKPLPLLLGVPGFKGIRIHAGNTAEQSSGCLLTGTDYETDRVNNSRVAFLKLATAIEIATEVEKVWIEIVRDVVVSA